MPKKSNKEIPIKKSNISEEERKNKILEKFKKVTGKKEVTDAEKIALGI